MVMDSIEVAPDPPPPAYLAIPFDAESVLPKRSLSVTELLQYNFPNLSQVPHEDAGIPVWSEAPPHDVNATLLLSCVVPRWETVKWLLLDVWRLASTPRSFSRASVSSSEVLPNHLPVWVLSFWDRLSEAYDACLLWRRSLGWVDTLRARCPEDRRLATELGSLFCRVPWCGYLSGKRRDRRVGDIFDLLSNNELNSGQIDDLLELIERGLTNTPDNRYLIASTDLSTLLLYSHQNHAESTYRKQPTQWLVEEELIQRRRLAVASIAWIPIGGRGHWISYVVDPITSTILHGDSLGHSLPVDLRDALQWWLCDLRERMGEPRKLPGFEPISTTSQEDGFSCGILSTNSLHHHLLPCKFPLVLRDAASIKRYRIERTIEILKLSIESPVREFLNFLHVFSR